MFKSVSYYVQQMYAQNKGTNMMTLTMDKKPVAGQDGQDGLFASSVFDKNTGEIIVKVINTSKQKQAVTLNLLGIKGERTAQTITLCHNGMDDENTLDNPEKITSKQGTLQCEAGKSNTFLNDELQPMSFRLYKIKK
jgi:alpha-L-arabinofuranosidase